MSAHTKETIIKKLKDATKKNKRIPNTHSIKLSLVRLGLMKYECSICSISNWQGREISLHLDHIDGNAVNNNLENLRLLCPNCHSQTDSYCGKNTRKYENRNKACVDCGKINSSFWSDRCIDCHKSSVKKEDKKCIDCGIIISKNSTKCKGCCSSKRSNMTKMSDLDLIKILSKHSSVNSAAKEIEVSWNGLKKALNKRGITYESHLKKL